MYLFFGARKGCHLFFSFGVDGHPSTVLFGRGWPPIYFSLWRGWSSIYFLFGFLFRRGMPNCLLFCLEVSIWEGVAFVFLFGGAGHLFISYLGGDGHQSIFNLGGDGFCFSIWRGWPFIYYLGGDGHLSIFKFGDGHLFFWQRLF